MMIHCDERGVCRVSTCWFAILFVRELTYCLFYLVSVRAPAVWLRLLRECGCAREPDDKPFLSRIVRRNEMRGVPFGKDEEYE